MVEMKKIYFQILHLCRNKFQSILTCVTRVLLEILVYYFIILGRIVALRVVLRWCFEATRLIILLFAIFTIFKLRYDLFTPLICGDCIAELYVKRNLIKRCLHDYFKYFKHPTTENIRTLNV